MTVLRHLCCWVKQRGRWRAWSQGRKTHTRTNTHTTSRTGPLCLRSHGVRDRMWESERWKSLLTVLTVQVSDRNGGTHTHTHTESLTDWIKCIKYCVRMFASLCVSVLHRVNDSLNWCKQISLPLLLILHPLMERQPLPEDNMEKLRWDVFDEHEQAHGNTHARSFTHTHNLHTYSYTCMLYVLYNY